jgi:hypothetical protein
MDREYIKIKKPTPLTDFISHQRELDNDVWKNLVFYHLLIFYQNYDSVELKNKITTEQSKTYPRTEREIAKYIRKQLNNNREFSMFFKAFGEITNDEDVEGSYDITISNTYWKNEFYFECKNLNTSQDLVNKYVFYKMKPTQNDGGVYRYFNGKYAQNQNFGGMLGFVINGNIDDIKNKIVDKMNTKFDISPEGDIINIEYNAIEGNDFTFTTNHNRLNEEFILHHILFDFSA